MDILTAQALIASGKIQETGWIFQHLISQLITMIKSPSGTARLQGMCEQGSGTPVKAEIQQEEKKTRHGGASAILELSAKMFKEEIHCISISEAGRPYAGRKAVREQGFLFLRVFMLA